MLGSTWASVVTGEVRSHLGNLDVASPSMDTPGPRHEEGLGERGRSEGADKWGFLFN